MEQLMKEQGLTEEEAMKIAKKRASEDDYDSLSTNYDKSSVYCTRADEEE